MIASGHAKNTGHSEATSAAHEPPGSEPGCASSATHAYGSAASTATSDSAPTTRIQPIGLRGRRATISAPTAAGVQVAARRNGYSHHAPDPDTSSAAATRSSESPAAVRTKAVRARPHAIRRDAICTGPFSPARAPTATVLPPKCAKERAQWSASGVDAEDAATACDPGNLRPAPCYARLVGASFTQSAAGACLMSTRCQPAPEANRNQRARKRLHTAESAARCNPPQPYAPKW